MSDEQTAAYDALEEALNLERTSRADDMPTEQDAINAMFRAYLRLKELGWKEAIYCPKDGTPFLSIEPGSTGIGRTYYHGKWPTGSWFVAEAGDLWPSRPCLYKPIGSVLIKT